MPGDPTLDYEATLSLHETEFRADLEGTARSRGPGPGLLGQAPQMRLAGGLVLLTAAPQDRPRLFRSGAPARSAMLPVGLRFSGLLAAGDTLRVARGPGGEVGLSVLRGGSLLLALGQLGPLLPLDLPPGPPLTSFSEPGNELARSLELRLGEKAHPLDEGEYLAAGPYTVHLHLYTELMVTGRKVCLSVAKLGGRLTAEAVSFTAGALSSGGLTTEGW